MIIRLFHVFLIFMTSSLKVFAEVKTVTGNRGGDAVLPCNTEAHEDSRATVFWRYKTNIIVHSVNDGVENLSQQDSRFKNRTRMFPNEFRQGKFSLELSRLQDNDTGSYTCYIPSKSFQEHIELNVTYPPPTPPPPPSIGPRSCCGFIKFEHYLLYLFFSYVLCLSNV